jgi:hypothetical protein
MNKFLGLFTKFSSQSKTFDGDSVHGSGKTCIQKRDVRPFKKVEVSGAIQLNLALSSETISVTVLCDENILPLIMTEVVGDVLRIYSDGSYTTKTQSVINLSAPEVVKVSSSGSSDVIITAVDQEEIAVSTSGSGDMTVTGKAQSTKLRVSGSASIRSVSLDTEILDAKVSGSGSIKASAKSSAALQVSGSGSIEVWGRPQSVQSKRSGSGSIHMR